MEIREAILNMDMEEIRSRISAIATEMNADDANIEELTLEVDELQFRKAELEKIAEQRTALKEKVAVEGKVVKEFSEKLEERKMTNMEIRDSLEYGKAFVKAIMTDDDTECRALLTEAVSGTIPVPTALDNEIRNAWETAQLISLVKTTTYSGNIKVGFEYSATGAHIHVEGSAAPEEEVLVLGTVDLIPQTIKKWITISDEAIENTTIDTLGYVYKEIAQKIAEKAEEILIGKILAAPATTTQTAPGVPVYTANAVAEDTLIMALAELSGQARNIHIAMNRKTYAALRGVQAKAKYNVDVFDGLKDRIVFTEFLPGVADAGSGETYIIAGDFGYGFQANRPGGYAMKIVVDDKSLAEKDLIKVVGKQNVALGVVAPKAFVKVAKPE